MRIVFSAAVVAGTLLLPRGANAVSVTLTDSIAVGADTLVYASTGLPTTTLGGGTLTIATTGTGFDGIDLGSSTGEFMDVDLAGTDPGRFECGVANDGGTLISGATGDDNCLFSFDLTVTQGALGAAIADGAATVTLAMGQTVDFFFGEGADEIAVTLQYEEGSAVVPLPASLPFLLAGLGGLALIARRR